MKKFNIGDSENGVECSKKEKPVIVEDIIEIIEIIKEQEKYNKIINNGKGR